MTSPICCSGPRRAVFTAPTIAGPLDRVPARGLHHALRSLWRGVWLGLAFAGLPAALQAAAEVQVTGNGQSIVDGDTSAVEADHTDFGNVLTDGGTVSHTFTISNTGDAVLALGTVTITGSNAVDFSVTTQPDSSVAVGSSTTFTVRFAPASTLSLSGSRTANVSFTTSDADENPFNFGLKGSAVYNLTSATPLAVGTELAMTANTLKKPVAGDPDSFRIDPLPPSATSLIYVTETSNPVIAGNSYPISQLANLKFKAVSAGTYTFAVAFFATSEVDEQEVLIRTTTYGVIVGDETAPSVTISSSASNPTNLATIPITVTFSEAVTGFDINDLTIDSGSLDHFSGSGSVYTVELLPEGDGAITVNIDAGVAIDGAENSNTAATPFTITSDRTPPKVVDITSDNADGYFKLGATITLKVKFSEAVTLVQGSSAPHFALNADAAAKAIYTTGSGSDTLTFTYTPALGHSAADLEQINSLVLNDGTLRDAAGNDASLTLPGHDEEGSLATNKNLVVDAIYPAIWSIKRSEPSEQTLPQDTFSVTYAVTFTEPVTGVDADDFTVTKTAGAGTNHAVVQGVSPQGNGVFAVTVGDLGPNITIRLDLKSTETDIFDLAGNPQTGGFTSGDTYVVPADTTAPQFFTSSPEDGAINVAVSANIVLEFSEIVVRGTGDITLDAPGLDDDVSIPVSNTTLVTIDMGTVTINPAADLAPGVTYQVTVPAGAFKDGANINSASGQFSFTTTPPPFSTMTTGVDTYTDAGGIDDAISAAGGTINDGDAIAAGNGTDTFDATLADGETTGPATLSGFENLNLTVGAGHSATLNALNITASTIKPKGAGTHIITNAKVNVDGSGLAVGGTTNVTFTGTTGTLTGGAANDNFTLTQPLTTQFTINGGAGTGDSLTAPVNGASSLAPAISNVELLTLDSTGATSSVNLSAVSGIKTITITGSAELTLTSNPSAVSSITSIAAGAFTGKLKLNIDSALATVQGGSGNDEIIVSIGNSTGLYTVKGGPGNDDISSGNSGDTFDGEEGDDTLFGGPGDETLTGGLGDDIFRYSTGTPGTDRITDFGVGADRIRVSSRVLAGITTGDGTSVPENGVQVGAYDSGTNTTPLFLDQNAAQDVTRIRINLTGDYTGKIGIQGGDVVYVPGPVLSSTTPLDNAIEVAANANLVLTFNKAITAVADKDIVIRRVSDSAVAATIEATDQTQVAVSGMTATIDPAVTLLHGTAYYVQIDEGAFVDGGSLPYPGIANATTFNFTTEVKAEVNATDSDALASYLANATVSTINLTENGSYTLTGATIARALTLQGHGATIATGVGLLRTVVRGSMFSDDTNVPVLLEVGSGGSLTLEQVTVQNNGNQSADTGILAVVNVKNGGSLIADHVTFRDFHNNVTPGTNRAFAIHAEPNAVTTTVTNSTFGSSNAFRSAIAIRGGEFTLTGNTFLGTAEPDRLPNDDGYEYAIYLYGGAGTVTDNTISGFDSAKQIGYTSAGVALFGAADLSVTIEDNIFLNSIDPEADASDNGHDIDLTRSWKPNTDPVVTITVDGQDYLLGPTANAEAAFKAGEALRAGNDTDKVAVLLDQNDEVLIKETGLLKDFAVLGGYRSNYLSVSDSTPVSVKLSFPTTGDQALVIAAATKVDIEQQKDDETTWTELQSTWTGVPATIDLTLEPNRIYRFRAKLTHPSFVETSDPTPRFPETYTNPVTVDTAAPPSITSELTASGTYGAPFTYTITASNTPTSFSATGLPAGLSVDAGTGVISGTPTAPGSFDVTLTSTNNVGTGPSATLTVSIAKATATVTLGGLSHVYSGGSASAEASTSPANLPVSFSYNGNASEPVNAGSYAVVATVNSPNYAGSASGTLVIAAASQTINFVGPDDLLIGQSTALKATASSGLAVSFSVVNGPATISGNTLTATGVGTVTVRASRSGSGNYRAAPNVERSFNVTIGSPVVTTPEEVPVPPAGGTAELVVTNSNPNVTYQWQRNGSNLPNGTGASLTLDDVQPPTAGLYTYTATVPGGGGGTSEPVIVGLTTDEKVVGTGEQVLADVIHPNGNVYDQILLEGDGASITADPAKITRISFVDLTNDIVQVEFTGAGTLSVVMDDASQPSPPINYNQENVDYVRGHVGLVITGANETSNLSVFSVGPVTAVNQSLFKEGVTYDGVADLAFVAIQSTNGKFGGIRTGNAHYYASQGFTGVYAPGVEFAGPVNIGEVTAFDSATPVLVFGAIDTVRITGGSLEQDNDMPVTVRGIDQVRFVDGRTSQDVILPAQQNKGVLTEEGVDVTDLIVDNP